MSSGVASGSVGLTANETSNADIQKSIGKKKESQPDDGSEAEAFKKNKKAKPYIIHRDANCIVMAGYGHLYKTERVSYTYGTDDME